MSLTAEDVATVLGPVEETLVADIIRTGASREELVQAWAWVSSDEAMIGDGRPLPSGRVAALVELLAPEEEEPEA
ncbi:hypothetical protein [Inquilinus limosus]|uniref:hypothetical protein n=1 Tax=Inquilinus limosus TaxID=171674 RepID=UPI00047A5784|nr:hypothetical protein [Inquilinus limosus]